MTTHLARRSLGLLVVFAFVLSIAPAAAAVPVAPLATTLTAGDVAIIGYNADDPDQFAFVLLVNISIGTQINFTDNGWLSSGGFRTGEGTLTWIASTDLCAGTIIDPGVGSMQFAAAGDQVLAYQGTTVSPTFIYALNNEGAGVWQADAANSNTSALPTGLTNGTTAVALNEIDNAVYNGTLTSGTRATLLSAISNKANWIGDDAVRQTIPNGPFTVTDATPCGGDTPPTVSGTNPDNGASGVVVNTNITVTFTEPVTIINIDSFFDIFCEVSGLPTLQPATGSGISTTFTIDPTSDLPPGSTCSVTIKAAEVVDQDGTPNTMATDYVFTFATFGGISKIHDIQGSGNTAGSGTFTVEAIVTGDYQGVTGVDDFKLDGFFIQEEDTDADANPATSEGIFVFCQTCPTNVVVGDKVQVTGPSSEYFNMSQLNATTAGSVVMVSGGNPLPAPTAITLPVPGVTAIDLAGAQTQINAYYEPFEGMLVQIGAQLSVTEYFELFRYGQLVLAQGGRFRQFTDANAPSVSGYTAHQIDLARRKVMLDDDSNQQNHALAEIPDIPVFHPTPGGFSTTNYVRGGDTITNLTGVLHWSFAGLTGTDAWRIRPVTSAFSYAFTPGNPRTSAPEAVGGNLQVGSFNTLNFFTTLDTGGLPCGPVGNKQACRGANSAAELTRQRDKLVAAICAIDADVLGLMELENLDPINDPAPGDGIADYVLKDLVDAINASGSPCPDKTYVFTDGTAAGTDAIRVGIIYKTSSVTPIGIPVALMASDFTDPNNTGTPKSRPALAQTFEDNTWGERFTIVANHLKSKGSCPTTIPLLDTDQSDGQGCWNDTRQQAAAYLVNSWLPNDPTLSGDPDFLIVGDMNAYRKEAPIATIAVAGYTDLIQSYGGASAYGYLFDGQLGYLDHALSAAALTPQVTGATEWHINADEVNLLDYNDTVQDLPAEQSFDAKPMATTLYNADAYRSTDHDPVLVGLGLYPDLSDLMGYGLAWHTGQGTPWRLGTTWTGEASSGLGTDVDDGIARDYTQSWNDASGEVTVTVTGPASQWACLNAWLDYSDGTAVAGTVELPDGVFNPNEHVVDNLAIQSGANQLVSWPLEQGVIDSAAQYNMRYRLVPDPNNDGDCGDVTLVAAAAPLTPDGGANSTGRADGGEVEDYTFGAGPLAVTLASFSAAQQSDAVQLAWETTTELNNFGFNVYRGRSQVGPDRKLNEAFIPSQSPGNSSGFIYTWDDRADLTPGTSYFYWVEDVSTSGATTLHGPVSVNYQAPTAVRLSGMDASPAAPLALPGVLPVALAGLVALAGAVGLRRRR